MNIFIYIASSLFFMWSVSQSNLQTYRTGYSKAATDKILCERMIRDLEKEKNNSSLYLGYLGGYQTVWAKHVFSPMTKLQTFKTGKKNIEKAIEQDPSNIELRFIRLSVQKNAPTFLGYHSHVKNDKEFIVKNRSKVQSEILKKNIDLLLKD
ncbi:hypothetical protein [Chryseobacterium sp. A321]